MTYFNNMRCHSLVNLMANFFCGGHEGAFFIKEAFLEEAKMTRGLFGGGQNDRRPFLREDNLELPQFDPPPLQNRSDLYLVIPCVPKKCLLK
jgi:hypothetical protein